MSLCSSRRPARPGAAGPAVMAAGPLSDGPYIRGGRSVGPAALFSLQLSYVTFMPFVERPALRGRRWQRQAEDNKGGCQRALQDLAEDSVRWPQLGRGRRVQSCPQVFKSFIVLPPPWLEGFPLLGFGPAFPSASRVLFIDSKTDFKVNILPAYFPHGGCFLSEEQRRDQWEPCLSRGRSRQGSAAD